MTDLSSDFTDDCMRWRGRVLNGDYAHWCPDWDGLPIDETCNEWPCNCGYKEWKDDTDAQPNPALKAAQEQTKGVLTEADTEMSKHFVEMADRIEELEAKLAKAVDVLGYYARNDDGGELASETIKELTGGKDD